MYSCYVIISSSSPSSKKKESVYTGVTNNFVKRLRRHNEEISGGAKSTRGRKDWKPLLLVEGFKTQGLALQFERLMKGKKIYLTKNTHTIVRLTTKGTTGRIKQLEKCLPIFSSSSSKLHVTCFLSKTEYLKHAKITENEFETRGQSIFTFTK